MSINNTNDKIESQRTAIEQGRQPATPHPSGPPPGMVIPPSANGDASGALPTVDDVIATVTDADAKKSKPGRPSHAEKLLAALGNVDLYRDKTSDHPYCDMVENGVRHTYAVDGSVFKGAVIRLSCTLNKGVAMPPGAIQQVIDTCMAKAMEAEARDVFLRFGRRDKEVWIDLGDDTWKCIRITPKGWDIVPYDSVPVSFWRPSGLLPLPRPRPVPADNAAAVLQVIMGELFHLSDQHILLLSVSMTAAMCCKAPYTISNFYGRPGSAKTTAMQLARRAIDPVRTLHVNIPNSVEDLMVYARSHAIPCIDNASALTNEILDAVCGIATGQGHTDRAHYTRNDATDFMVMRPLWFTSVGPVTVRGDASSRALDLLVKRITGSDRKLIEEIERAFEMHHPALLGALLEVAVAGLNGAPRPARLPRTADFYYWGVGAGTALKVLGDFETVFKAHKDEQARQAIENTPVLLAVDALFSMGDQSYASVTGRAGVGVDYGTTGVSIVPLPPPAGTPQAALTPQGFAGSSTRFSLKGRIDFDANGNVERWTGRMSELHRDLAFVKYGQEPVKQAGWPMLAQHLGTVLEHGGEQLETALRLEFKRPTGIGSKNRPVVELVRIP